MTSPEGWLHDVNKLERSETTVHCPLSTRSAPARVQAQGGAAPVSGPHPRRWDVTQSGTSSSVAAWSEWNILEEKCQGIHKEPQTKDSWCLASHQPGMEEGPDLGGAGRCFSKSHSEGERSLPHLLNRPVPNLEA